MMSPVKCKCYAYFSSATDVVCLCVHRLLVGVLNKQRCSNGLPMVHPCT